MSPAAPPKAAPSFAEVQREVEALVRRVFPHAEPAEAMGMKGWRIRRPPGAPRPAREGTMPSDWTMVLLADRKTGPTLHLWYPGDYYLFDAHRDMLAKAGFKVMRGCLPFERKASYPYEAVEALLRDVKARDG